MLGLSALLGAALAMSPSGDDPLPLRTAEQLEGAELLHWRLVMHAAVRDGRPARAAEVGAALIGEDPSAHWARTLLARELCRLRLRDPATRRAIELPDLPFHGDCIPVDRTVLEHWCWRRSPWVPASALLLCASHARSEGRWQEASAWVERALDQCPITEHSFFSTTLALARTGLYAGRPCPRVHRQLEALTGGLPLDREDLLWFEGELDAFLRAAPGAATRALGRSLLDRHPDGRFALAIRLRLASPSHAETSERWRDRALTVAAACERGLDAAAILFRLALAGREDRAGHPPARALLRNALDLAPDGILRQQVAAESLLLSARERSPTATLIALVNEHWRAEPEALHPLLAPGENALQLLLGRGEPDAAARLAEAMLGRIGTHPYRARLLHLLAELEPDPSRALALEQQALAVAELGTCPGEPAPLAALDAISVAHARAGRRAEAVQALALQRALSPIPAPLGDRTRREWEELFRLQGQAGRDPAEIREDRRLLLGAGCGLDSEAGRDRWEEGRERSSLDLAPRTPARRPR